MKKQLLFWSKALAVLALTLFFVFGIVSPQYTENYNASILDKVKRLSSIEGPKIVLIGNSNLPFGINSERIEEAFDMPVVNMGIHGGLGNAFHEQLARINIQPGDIYIICHTEYDDDDTIGDPSLAWITIENHFSLWRLIRWKDVLPMADAFSTYLKKAIDVWVEGDTATEDPMYTRESFNVYGDNRYPREMRNPSITLSFEEQMLPQIGEKCVQRLNALNQEIVSKGATMLVAAYPIANGEYTPLVADYDAFSEALAEALDAPVISYFPDYMIDYEYFYDTLYHLTNAGVEIRTNLLIEDLRLWMDMT